MPITINGTGSITGISAGGLPDNCVTVADLATTLDLSSNTVTLPSGLGGKILQVITTQYDTTTSISLSDNTWTALPFYAEITPNNASSRFIVSYQSGGELGSGAHWNTPCGLGRANNSGSGFGSISWFEPNTGNLGNRTPGLGMPAQSYHNDDNSSTPEQIEVNNYVDSPNTTDTLRYYGGLTSDSSQTWYVNRTVADTNSNGYEQFRSWITVIEVAG
mgnify:CR=1 FL=1|tara:strand:+ start:22 stop:675 length:654 start_codon:yes stop_codon:yes gene_type:complete